MTELKIEVKYCRKCQKVKYLNEFYKSSSNKLHGLMSNCIDCVAENCKKYREKMRETKIKIKKEKIQKEDKYCKKCQKTKPVNDFYKSSSNKSYGLMSNCKECVYDNVKKYQQNKIVIIKEEKLPKEEKYCRKCQKNKHVSDFYKSTRKKRHMV